MSLTLILWLYYEKLWFDNLTGFSIIYEYNKINEYTVDDSNRKISAIINAIALWSNLER